MEGVGNVMQGMSGVEYVVYNMGRISASMSHC